MSKHLTIQCCNDSKSYYFGYIFRCNNVIVAQCDEDEYHEVLNNLLGQGYTL